MTQPIDDIQKAMSIFDIVCDLPPDERSATLDQLCDRNLALRDRVERMLAAENQGNALFGDSNQGAGAAFLSDELADSEDEHDVPEHIDRYKIIRVLGRGGMGIVYEAEQENPRRRVALKVIRQSIGGHQMMRRFRQEVHVLGQLRHPSIAQIIEAGTTQLNGTNISYYTMELIEGESIDAFARSIDRRQRLELMARVCDAVHHAHQRGIIHRDLKPANILVVEESPTTASRTKYDTSSRTAIDQVGLPKILDFGIARLIDDDASMTTLQTGVGQIIGTLGYMSPEQIAGNSGQLDIRCDVYALGVILYQLLTGQMPFDLQGKPLAEAARVLQEDDPTQPASIDKSLRGDIDTIISKAIEKSPDRRYASAAALADDLRRHLTSEPIAAHPPSAFYQFKKFTGRNKAIVGGAVATLVVLVVGLISTGYFLVEATRQRDEAIAARQEADRERDRTTTVANFQASLLKELRTNKFGKRMLSELRKELKKHPGTASSESTHNETDESRNRKIAIDALNEINVTNVSRNLLSGTLADRARKRIDNGYTDDPLTEARLRYSVAAMYRSLGMADDALSQCEIALKLEREHLGADYKATLISGRFVAHRYMDIGRMDDAEDLFRDTLERAQRAYGTDDKFTLSMMRALADLLMAEGKLEEAESLLASSLEKSRRIFGEDDLPTLKAHNTYCTLLMQQGKLDEALSCFHETLKAHEKVRGLDHKDTLVARNNLMATLFNQGQFEAAVPIARDVIASNARTLGDQHPNTILSRNNLGVVLLNLGRPGEAEPYVRQAHNDATATLNPAHQVRMKSTGNLIDALITLDNAADAVPLCHELIQTRRDLDPPQPGLVAQTLEQLGTAHFQLSDFTDARDAWSECVELRAVISSNHWLTNRARSELGSALAAMGAFDEAEPLLLDSFRALQSQRESIPHVAGANCLEDARQRLIDLYVAWSKPDEAATWRELDITSTQPVERAAKAESN